MRHTAHASSHKNPTTSLRSFNVGDPKMNSHTDLFAGDWFLVPKWKAQAIVSFNKIEMEREIHAVVCREKEREKEMEREIHAVKMQMKEEQLQMTDRMARLELSLQYERKESLRAKGLLTGRGVLEFALKQVHHERKLQKNFNAQRTCESLDDESPHVNTDAWKLQ